MSLSYIEMYRAAFFNICATEFFGRVGITGEKKIEG